jgi:MFS transporter, FHS family, L-fucose permease
MIGASQMQDSTSVSTEAISKRKAPHVFPAGQMTLFVLVTVLFFMWGMSNNLTDILVQQFKKSFELSQFSAQLVQSACREGHQETHDQDGG